MTAKWDETFENLVRAALVDYPPSEPMGPETPLPAHGLDSLAMVGLSSRLEDAYGIDLPDEALVPATFATPGTLWETVRGCLARRV